MADLRVQIRIDWPNGGGWSYAEFTVDESMTSYEVALRHLEPGYIAAKMRALEHAAEVTSR